MSSEESLPEMTMEEKLQRSTIMSVPASAWVAPSVEVPTRSTNASMPGLVNEDKVEVFSSLPTVAERRKKHMAWIHKSQPEAPKSEEDDKQPRVFSQLSAECARDAVRRKAVENFGPPPPASDTRWALIVKHPYFERMSLMMIYFNALWIAIDIEFNKAEMVLKATEPFLIMEILFTLYFSGELFVRWMSYKKTRQAFMDSWFLFDCLLVTMMLLETWLIPITALLIEGGSLTGGSLSRSASVLRIARILRVFRTARIIRVARYMPELMILVKGLIVAARSVFFTLVLLLLITYVFSIALAQLSVETHLKEKYFNTMPTAVLNLVVQCVMPDQEEFFTDVADTSWVMGTLVLIFVLVGSLIVMNMLVGILVEAVQTVATMEHEQIHVDFAKRVLWDLIKEQGADEDGDNRISEDEFVRLLARPEASKALSRLGVDAYAVMETGKLLFEDGEPLTFGEFMDAILTLRGTNQTTVKDIVNLRKFTADEFSQLHTVLMDLCKFLAGHGMSTMLAKQLEHIEIKRPRSGNGTKDIDEVALWPAITLQSQVEVEQ
ncbi:unnamed protein product [Durusdinium trenchii]|uniref:Ion transport domain-containing protein n=1 Tax=Durusdinium trenchii TaxID=1381693 RepID=A0ABP0KIG6_9DINO